MPVSVRGLKIFQSLAFMREIIRVLVQDIFMNTGIVKTYCKEMGIVKTSPGSYRLKKH